ncbi:lantibiotic dehydratase [Paenibacillus sp. SI8]|uniref:lantibiotic dehydratase n=1 Tax=unclassified Paenibacillus TaxID=185978 RepID=UPI00346647D4
MSPVIDAPEKIGIEPNVLFRTLDFFMLRAPLLSLNDYTKYFPAQWTGQESLRKETLNNLIDLSHDPVIREAIAVSSPSLLESLPNLANDQNPRKQSQAVKGFMRYLLRMMTRSTPFGLFSGVAFGRFDEHNNLLVKEAGSFQKRSRPDMEWLLKIIEMAESREDVVFQLLVQRNPLSYRQGDRAKIPYAARYGKLGVGENDSVSVRASEVYDRVMEESAVPIRVSDLIDRIKLRYEGAELDTIRAYVWQLFQQEFLISELRPSTTSTDPFSHVLSVLDAVEGLDELQASLKRIDKEIRFYDSLPLGVGEAHLTQLQNSMKELADVKSPLQIDLSLNTDSITLPSRVRQDVERAADLIWRLSAGKHSHRHLEEYMNEFMEKYGQYREIPLLELLDEELGMGAPASYLNPPSSREIKRPLPPFSTKRESLLLQWLVSALHKGDTEIALTNERIQQLADVESGTSNDSLAMPSMELYFSLVTDASETVDEGGYTLILGPNPGSDGAGKTFGRFIDLMDESSKMMFPVIQSEEQRQEPDKIFAEISYLPSAGRATNVILTENYREYEIGVGTNVKLSKERTINVSDLVVGVANNHFYIKSSKHDAEIIPTAGHMLNIQRTPNVYRFLREISQHRYHQWGLLDWGPMAQSPFIPRIRYENIVLTPATWKVKDESPDSDNEQIKEQYVQQFRKEWDVPRYVYLIQFDNRILLDLDNPFHIEVLCKDLRTFGEITLIEHFGGFEQSPVHRRDGQLLAEFVFPLVKRSVREEDKAVQLQRNKSADLPAIRATERIHLPGSTWLYGKLYGLDSRQDEFIGRSWIDFCQSCRQLELVDKVYFIRYADPNKHLRIRFHMDSEEAQATFLPRFHEWLNTLYKDGFVSKVVLDTYEPEIERYGGPSLMILAEQMFTYDSDVTAHLIRIVRFTQLSLSLETIAVMSVLALMRQFGLNEAEINALLNKNFGAKDYLDEFREQRRMFLILLDPEQLQLESSSPEALTIYQILQHRENAVRQYASEVTRLEAEGHLTNTKEDILFSTIHMHLNRLLGINQEKERKVMILARHSFDSWIQYRRKR